MPHQPPRRMSTGPGRLADGSFTGGRLQSATVRAIDSYRNVQRIATKLAAELDDATPPHGIPVTELGDEDSAVHVVATAIEQLRKPT